MRQTHREVETVARVGRRRISGRECLPIMERVDGIQSIGRSWSRLELEQGLFRGDIMA